ncbi:MAG TPA: thiamine pyrophosphate-dependent enzyme [Candidatus Hydrothermia bacterium]|nr:pyruvate ferredoxin oxidoreductase [Candidatus Hydrothermae bacterium]MDD3649452.1 thiamine pyrophosphate-dependent enzyme [Candidatus Hydrothermia bacterium]MDD5573390.1 thiamine pyrophosphate-dependent enzyme [Candidatus Hydrothermia bacterium]HOK22829.1 thiamine pyrophosphate-dependent enzyme [Candidatus Hydrothermia bacterium]HOL23538.1 thiamine pyrophosphate-dependent enzyme [Candidatus Hydrothermia bacterium]
MADNFSLSLRELAKRNRGLASGHRACAGCPFPAVIRMTLSASDFPVVVANATGCMEVTTSIFPYGAWPVPWIHSAFENTAATISGVETAYKALIRKGVIPESKKIKFIAFGGDGGTYDIGIQSLSGAAERGHNFLYILYDNEGYMNTGIQRSSSTPYGASTTTSPAGKVIPGKLQHKKPIVDIMAAHGIPYAAQASVSHWNDYIKKVRKALSIDGPTFISVYSPCVPGWGYPESKSIELAKLAVESGFWPLYEVENGIYNINYRPRNPIPVEDFLKSQSRFAHVLKRPELIEEIKEFMRKIWDFLEFMSTRKESEDKKENV